MASAVKSVTSQRLGDLISYQKTDTGIVASTTHGKFRVNYYSPFIFRISITQEDFFDEFSYSVIAREAASQFTLDEAEGGITLTTSAMKLVITKHPVRFRLTDLNGEIINEDDAGLGTAWVGEQVTTYKKIQEGERFIGLGEKTGGLDRKGSAYQNWNSDAFAYGSGADPLYCSTPFYMGIHHHQMYGIFFDNTHKSFFNFGASNNRFSSFAADAGEMNYYLIYGKSVAQIIQGYTYLTGMIEMPPLWSIGYQQCRYSYYPDKEVLNLAQTFREKDIPADAIVLDIHYMDEYKIFTWDGKKFPDPKTMIASLKSMGFEVVVMCDPGIKIEKGYEPYDDGIAKDVFIKYPDGENYEGQVWPGWCHFPDFSDQKTRDWWGTKFKDYADLGVLGYWNDMNEIATWGQALPENLELSFEGNKNTTRRGRNIYGFQMARSTYEGAKKQLNGKRPFNLTRAGFSGVQRYAAVWTGDNVSYDEHMMLGVRMVNSMGLTGIAFAGYDVGGFVGDANTKLFARWISIGALSPFFRGHTMINSRDSEPWSYGEEVEMIARNYIKLRYQLMPYIYSLFYEASQTGMPVQRSLAINYPFVSQIYHYANQYLFGPSILVAPVESNKDMVKVYLPEGDWYYLYDGKKFAGHQEIILDCPVHKLPVFIKAGAILPMQLAHANTRVEQESVNIHIYQGSEPSEFLLYRDDGITYEYQSQAFAKQLIRFNPVQRSIIIEKQEGHFNSSLRKVIFYFHGFAKIDTMHYGQQQLSVSPVTYSFFSPLEKFDPFYDPDSMGEEELQRIELAYSSERIEINW